MGDPLDLRRNQSLAFLLNRPFFDLGPAHPDAPLHARAADLVGRWMEAGTVDRAGPNMGMTSVFRKTLIRESRLWEYGDDPPESLPAELRTDRWQLLVDQLANWPRLSPETRLAAGRALMALTCQQRAADLLWPPVIGPDTTDGCSAGLAVLGFAAAYQLGRASRRELVEGLLMLVDDTAPGGLARFSARLLLVSLVAPACRSASSVQHLCRQLHEELEAGRADTRRADWLRLSARSYALEGKLLVHRDRVRAAAALQNAAARLAEIAPETADDRLLVDEASRRVVDRRCLLAQLDRDSETALVHARRAVELDPCDSKAWLQHGSVLFAQGTAEAALLSFRRAAQLGPLFTGRAWFMAGQALERLERPAEADDSYLMARRMEASAAVGP